jgi:hypothetical protein
VDERDVAERRQYGPKAAQRDGLPGQPPAPMPRRSVPRPAGDRPQAARIQRPPRITIQHPLPRDWPGRSGHDAEPRWQAAQPAASSSSQQPPQSRQAGHGGQRGPDQRARQPWQPENAGHREPPSLGGRAASPRLAQDAAQPQPDGAAGLSQRDGRVAQCSPDRGAGGSLPEEPAAQPLPERAVQSLADWRGAQSRPGWRAAPSTAGPDAAGPEQGQTWPAAAAEETARKPAGRPPWAEAPPPAGADSHGSADSAASLMPGTALMLPPTRSMRTRGEAAMTAGGTPPAGPGPAAEVGPPPPWRTVLWTTITLWASRAFGRLAGSRRRQLTAVVTVAALVTAATAMQVVLAKRHPGLPGTATGQRSAGQRLTGAAVIRDAAAAWLARSIAGSTIVACDPAMCAALRAAGMQETSLLELGPSAPDPLGADIVVATPVIRNQYGVRLRSVYSASALATLGTGAAHVDVRVVAPDGAAAYQGDLASDLAARKSYGASLLRNSGIRLAPAARTALATGMVDARILVALPVLATAHPVDVLGFSGRAPGAGPGVPFTEVRLAGADSAAHLSPSRYQAWLNSFLTSQRVPYRPAQLTVVHGNRPFLIVRFAQPPPLNLLKNN